MSETKGKIIQVALNQKDQKLIDDESKELANELLSALSKENNPKAHVMQEQMLLRAATIILGMIISVQGEHHPEGPKRNSIIMDSANEVRDNILDIVAHYKKTMNTKGQQ